MNRKKIGYVILFSIITAVFASFFASSHPDGLEKVAEALGFAGKGNSFSALFTNYSTLTGVIGILLIYGLFKGIGILIARSSVK